MAFTYKDLQDEVKRRATIDQAGTQFEVAVKNIINTSLFRVSREGLWRQLRRKTTFDTVGTYTTGSGGGTFTNGSKSITMVGATFITDNIRIGRRIKLQGDSTEFVIKTITGETTLTIDQNYGGTTISGTGTYSILGQEEYNLPVQSNHRLFLWHEGFGSPQMLRYMTDQDFYRFGISNTSEQTATHYRMWGINMVDEQPTAASVISISSSSTSDTNIPVTVFGTVSGFPDSETITSNASDGTTAVAGLKSFSSVERIVKSSSSVGRITATSNTGNVTVSVLPVGDSTAGITYSKIQLHPLPNAVIPINVQYYKEPFRLVNDGDVHDLGQEFDESIILLSTAKLKFEQNQDEGEKFFSLYQDEIFSLRKVNIDKIDWMPTLRRPGASSGNDFVHRYLRANQAGANYGVSR
jgi:hypothetical protein